MKLTNISVLILVWTTAAVSAAHVAPLAFVSPLSLRPALLATTKATAMDTQEELNQKLDDIAHKLKLQVYDVNTGVYGFDSKDHAYGIENIHTDLHIAPDFAMGIELTEVAHSSTKDDRGLVLVSKVSGHAARDTPIQVGDTIIGVFAGPDFKESTTGFAYEDTIDVIERAKQHVIKTGGDKISLELNRLVKRAKVTLVVEDGKSTTTIDALAGDNLRSVLMHHAAKLYDDKTHRLDQPNIVGDCGGEGICGTCLVAVREGMSSLNEPPPQETSIMKSRPRTWRAACKTVLGANNQEGTVRIHLRPQTSEMENLLP